MNLEKASAMSLKLLTLNIEGHRHLERWPAKILLEKPDVVCMQEVFSADMPYIENTLGMKGFFAPMLDVNQENKYGINPLGTWGLGFFTNLEHTPEKTEYYFGSENLKPFELPNDASRLVLSSTVTKDGKQFSVGTTHFTWSDKGLTTDEQRRDFQELKKIIMGFDELILCGDFNAPRGKEIFGEFETLLTDNLPQDIISTIDHDLHYAGKIDLVVDTIFTTPHYKMSNVRVLNGVSDHLGVVGEVERA